jgi:hypothetical protein
VKKSYHPPATPCDRLLVHEAVEERVKAILRREREQLDPVELLIGFGKDSRLWRL